MNILLQQQSRIITAGHSLFATCRVEPSLRFQHSTSDEAAVPKPFSEMPQPKHLPLLGTLLDYTPFRNYEASKWYEFLKKRHEDLGPIYKEPKTVGMRDEFVATCNPDDIEVLFRNEPKWPTRPAMEFSVLARQKFGLGIGMSNEQGKEWYESRKFVNENLLTNDAVWNCAKEHLNVSEDFTAFVGKNLDENNELDVDELLYKWALENTIVFMLNSRLLSFFDENSDKADAIINTSHKIFDLSTKLGFSVPLWKIFNTKDFKELVKANKMQRECLNDFIQSRPNVGCSVFEKASTKSDISPEKKAVILPDFLAAGVDTTSNAAAFALYCVATNPEKQEILREEINKKMNSREEFTGKSLQRMRYMHAVLLEMQRVFPLTVGTNRILDKDLVLSGYQVPVGTTVLFTANVVNNMDEKYFEDPHSFLPERWINKNEYIHKKFALSGSFGMGPRMCPGRRFALQEIGCLLISLLSRYKLEYHHEPFETSFRLVSKPSKKARFTFVPL